MGAISTEGSAGLSGAALGKAVAVAVHLESVDVVGDAMEQNAGQALGSEVSVHSPNGRLLVIRWHHVRNAE